MITSQLLRMFDGDVICASFCKVLRLSNANHSRALWLGLSLLFKQGLFESYQNVATNGIANLQVERLLDRHRIPTFANIDLSALDELDTSAIALYVSRLRETRDALLPRLISGKLKVDHLAISLPPSMQAQAGAAA